MSDSVGSLTIPGPDPGACPDCGEWRKAGMTHECVSDSVGSRDIIAGLRAVSRAPAPEIVFLADAEAAVQAAADIIERLEATVVRADTVTGEKWSGDMVRWSDAEAAVQAAADTARSETWDAAQAEINAVRKSAADTRTREIVEALRESINPDDGYAAWGVAAAADFIARRFPVSDCEGDTDAD